MEIGDTTPFCWRNIFSCINLLRVLNKLTKWKQLRITVSFAKFLKKSGTFGDFWLLFGSFGELLASATRFDYGKTSSHALIYSQFSGIFAILATFWPILTPFEQCYHIFHIFTHFFWRSILSCIKVGKILKGSLDLIPSPSVKIQTMGRKVGLRSKGKTFPSSFFVHKVCWQCPARFGKKKRIQMFTTPWKWWPMGSNPGYLLNYSLIYFNDNLRYWDRRITYKVFWGTKNFYFFNKIL